MASEIFTTEASAEPAVLQLKMWVYLRKTCSLVQPLHKHLGSLHHGYAARAPCTRSLCYLEVPSVMQLSTWASHLAKPPIATLLTQNPEMTFGPSILFKKRHSFTTGVLKIWKHWNVWPAFLLRVRKSPELPGSWGSTAVSWLSPPAAPWLRGTGVPRTECSHSSNLWKMMSQNKVSGQ